MLSAFLLGTLSCLLLCQLPLLLCGLLLSLFLSGALPCLLLLRLLAQHDLPLSALLFGPLSRLFLFELLSPDLLLLRLLARSLHLFLLRLLSGLLLL